MRNNPLATRDDARRLLLALNEPLLSRFSPGRAQVRLGLDAAHFDRKAAWFEGFARPLWGLAPLHAGGGGYAHWELFREGIRSGTDPAHVEFWGQTTDHNQRSVEMAALGFGFAIAPDQLWDGLDPRTKQRAASWLGHIQSVEMADNNWHFFPVMAGLGLQRVGVAVDEPSKARHLEWIDVLYLSDGWYADGPGGHIDHYNGFALHFYGLIYARHMAVSDPKRAARYVERAVAFAQGFRHWFAADGATLVQGRSLTYRFACAGFWAALAYAGIEALPWGQIRGLWARHIRWWLQQEMTDASGVLSVGYRWPNYLMSEEYNSPGSPYWAFKAFLPLALPETHPFWTATEAPVPEPAAPVTLKGASMLLRHEAGDVIALTAGPPRTGMRNAQDKYAKFAYSTRFGLGVEADRWIGTGFCGDNILAFSHDGKHFSSRETNLSSRTGDGFVETTYQPTRGVRVETLQGFVTGWEIRVHRIECDEDCVAVESGHAVPARCGTRGQLFAPRAEETQGVALHVSDGHSSAICDLGGGRDARGVDCAPNTNLAFPHAAVPVLVGRIRAGQTVLVTAVRAFHDPQRVIMLGSPPDISALLNAAGWPKPPLSPVPKIRTEQFELMA